MADTQDETPYQTRTNIQPSSRLAKHRAPASSVDGDADSESESDISVELASTAASGSENRLYLRLALYAGGNILTLVLVLGLWTVWTLLSTFRNPMLWALLCSTALQDVKEDLIIGINRKLSEDRSVVVAFLLLFWWPFGTVVNTFSDVWHILLRWNQYVSEYEMSSLSKSSTGSETPFADPSLQIAHDSSAHHTSVSRAPKPEVPSTLEGAASTNQDPALGALDRKSSKRRASVKGGRNRRRRRNTLQLPPALQAIGQWLSAYTNMGVKAYQKEHASRRPIAEQPTSYEAAGRTTHQSNKLFSWLFKACIAYQLYDWLKVHWTATVHFAVLIATSALVLSLLPFLYFSVQLWWQSKTAPKAVSAPTPGHDIHNQPDTSEPPVQAGSKPGRPEAKKPRTAQSWGIETFNKVDKQLKAMLKANLHTLVAGSLILVLLVGSVALTGFLTLRIGQEGSSAVALVRASIPDRWRSTDSNTSQPVCDASSLNFTAVCEADVGFDAIPESAPEGVLQRWLGDYQETAFEYTQQGYAQMQEYIQTNYNDYIEANNLTQVSRDLSTLWATLQPASECSGEQKEGLLLEAALASNAAHATWQAQRQALAQVTHARQDLSEAISKWEDAVGSALQTSRGLLETAQDSSQPVHRLQQQVVQLQFDVKHHSAVLKQADREAESSKAELMMAQRRLSRCSEGPSAGSRHLLTAPARDLGRRLQQAYTHLWHLRLSEGWAMIKEVGLDAYGMVRQATQGNNSSSSELTALQRLAAAGSEPLLAVGRALGAHLVHSLGSTTSVAITGGLGLIRLGLGVVKLGVQFTLFVAMLFLLLSARQDPFQQAVRILPMSETARQHTADSFSEALRGVFQSALKLAVFHAVFTWLTFRAFSIQLVYVSTVASAVCSMLPLVQVWMVAIPAALQLLLQERMLAAGALMVLHVGAFFQADDVIMREIPGSHPYLTGLGILGGMYSFDNPLQGALLGPMLLSMLSVFYNLHAKLFRDETPGP